MQLFRDLAARAADLGFQYPRSDRRRCNTPRAISAPPRPALSVSSVGSEAMQRITWRRKRLRPAPFSILGRIGGDATNTVSPIAFCSWTLSVSSVGSEAMQLAFHRLPQARTLLFQYPRSDRRRCNDWRCDEGGYRHYSFSILGRIGGDATRGDQQRPVRALNFQYPRSDRRRCNKMSNSTTASQAWSFSILGRIGGDATKQSQTRTSTSACLSVSSVGSEAMQLMWVAVVFIALVAFSILGRIGGDATTSAGPTATPDYPPFSILGRIGGDATRGKVIGSNIVYNFQYPRSDRRRCNCAACDPVTAFAVPFSILGRIGGDATREESDDTHQYL